MKKSLQSSEWFLVASLLLIMVSLVTISKISATKATSQLSVEEKNQKKVLVTVEGAVKKPGSYFIEVGSSIQDVLKITKPLPNADLKKWLLLEEIQSDCRIEISELSEIVVSIKGAVVKPIELTLPVGSRICDLKSKILLSEDAEKAFFRRRKRLKNGDIICVPKKTVE